MSMPKFPTDVNLTRDDAINQILSSIAMEELGMSHIINAEGEKLQYVLGTLDGVISPPATITDVLKTNDSVRQTLEAVTNNQMLLRAKMSDALNSSVMQGPTGPTGATAPCSL